MKHLRGFTLIELMIVVAIIGILSTIAMNFYGRNAIAANRSEARRELTETSGSLEKCRSLYGSYNHANCNVALGFTTTSNYYTITGTVNPTNFDLAANPVAAGPQAGDTDCTSLTLSNTGVKAGTGANAMECW